MIERTFSWQLVLAGIVFTGIGAVASPAQALNLIDSDLVINGNARLEIGASTSKLNFANYSSGNGSFTLELGTTGRFSDFFSGANLVVKDLILNNDSPTSWSFNGSIPEFLVLDKGGSNKVTFELTQFTLEKVILGFGGPYWLGSFGGLFTDLLDGEVAFSQDGLFSSQGKNFPKSIGTSFSADVEAVPVPTPALLPGLIGLGLGALRKRKTEATESVEVEG